MTTRRHTSPSVGDTEAYRLLAYLLGQVDASSRRVEDSLAPQAGSDLAGDDLLTHPFDLSQSVALSLGSARDHLQALRTMTEGAQALHMVAPYTLIRAGLENSAYALWLLKPDDRALRVRRRLVMAVRDADEECAAFELLGDPAVAERVKAKRRRRIEGLVEAAGIAHGDVFGKAPGFGSIVRQAGPVPRSSIADLEGVWKLCSGYSHGQSWSLLSTAVMDQHPGQDPDALVHEYEVTASVPVVVTAVKAAVDMLKEAARMRDHRRLRFDLHKTVPRF